jgi:hypothetical protein
MSNFPNGFDPCKWFEARIAAKERLHRLRVEKRRQERAEREREKLTKPGNTRSKPPFRRR